MHKLKIGMLAAATLGSLLMASTAFAAEATTQTPAVARTGMHRGMMQRGTLGKHASSTPAFVGTGQPIIGGTITSVSGTTVVVTTSTGVVYTVDASTAKVARRGVTDATLATLVSGDSVIIQGVVNATTVKATTILDAPAPVVTSTTGAKKGFFGMMGGFFGRMFGF